MAHPTDFHVTYEITTARHVPKLIPAFVTVLLVSDTL